MIDIKTISIGDKVHYKPDYFKEGEYEIGKVKEIVGLLEGVRVVYHCAGDWDNFMDYTGALTNVMDLYYGWPHE